MSNNGAKENGCVGEGGQQEGVGGLLFYSQELMSCRDKDVWGKCGSRLADTWSANSLGKRNRKFLK